jgi:ribosomal protein S18 acetylase RimI-like enzyme
VALAERRPAPTWDRDPLVQTLLPGDVPRLRLGQTVHQEAVRSALAQLPNRSVWAPDALEFALLAPWRHRPDIAVCQELAAVRYPEALLRAAAERCRAAGDAMLVVMDMDEHRPPGFYDRAGFAPVESVMTYEAERSRVPVLPPGALRFERADTARPDHLAALLAIDHRAFPWLWRNSPAEFREYQYTPGVELHLGWDGARPVAYVGFTTFAGWGHLDRIATDPAHQGRGHGRDALAFVLRTLLGRGANRVGLSTQADNHRSRRLYEGFGFRRSPLYDYTLYGAALGGPALSLVAGPSAVGGSSLDG